MPRRCTRRQFVAAGAALAAAPADAAAQAEKSPLEATADHLLEVVKLRHGRHLTAAQLRQVHASLLRGLGSAQRLRVLRLSNADDPAAAFSADVP